MKNTHLNILLVEDNEGDILLTQEAFKEARYNNTMEIVRNGEEAINFLEKNKSTSSLPDMVLLDINLPKINGLQVLEHIKTDSFLRKIIVIMLSTSSSKKDITLAYQHSANCYITKPLDLNQFLSTIKSIEHFWMNIAQIPNSQ